MDNCCKKTARMLLQAAIRDIEKVNVPTLGDTWTAGCKCHRIVKVSVGVGQ